MAYSKVAASKAPPLRQPAIGVNVPDQPGLEENETAVTLDSGELVAVKVDVEPLQNTGGVALRPRARSINPDGSTVFVNDVALIVETSITLTAEQVAANTMEALMKDAAMLVLGEPQTVTEDVKEASGPPSKRSIVRHVDAGANLGSSIRHHLKVANAIKSAGKLKL